MELSPIILVVCIASTLSAVVTAIFMDWWQEREEQRQLAERARLDKVMQAVTPRAPGPHSRRVG